MNVAKRRGMARARVAVARKLAVKMPPAIPARFRLLISRYRDIALRFLLTPALNPAATTKNYVLMNAANNSRCDEIRIFE